ncbi:glucose-6-phosphate isomerase [Microbacteriaceae bacterium SG_E_30_P1]|uniref:Glucose-6-phosphate isomerase n=1 Tax=Antiquaquibacter oligotrophicus TaxID=2880260 RepID=A0ABT6KLN0_9MICO|nr:glucose-6-phosphate isomerase [Antiquaquibacter oligotrophicus]MDH6180922.1 glucose-6-phosphate isomerase [Antiquaquibacter oligotrophicus]UDF13374.1 glucose-6-phosphate isomerase [Antiquaquibacter oligotrophicus]
MSVKIALSGAAAEAVDRVVPQLVSDLVASRITSGDATLWGPDAEDEASKRLGWVEAVSISRPLVEDIVALRDKLRASGVNHIVLGGMGGSSLAPEVITQTYGVELTVLDSTDPGQVLSALGDRLSTTAVVISSKSGSTVETDSQKRIYEKYFTDAGIDPLERIVIVTDPGSPLDTSARQAGYRVFNADPNVGGRYSALTAFGLVPSGLAGVDISELLDEAEAMLLDLAVDTTTNPGLVLGAAIAGTKPLKDKLGIVADGTHIVGFGDWAEQLLAESTGKLGTGILPVVLDVNSPEITAGLPDVQIIRLVGDWEDTKHVAEGEIEITGTLGAQLMTWEYATAVAGRLLGINPFDQPDVESAKVATRALIDNPSETPAPAFVDDTVEVRGTSDVVSGVSTVSSAVDALLALIPSDGYVSIQAYVDRLEYPQLAELRDAIAARCGRPVTFGWGPRFLHSTGQFHKGGPAVGVFLQITTVEDEDLQIPDRPFTFGELIRAQAAGDASVLADHGRPVLSLTLRAGADSIPVILGTPA